MDINSIIAQNLRGLRDTQGLSLEALASLSGVSRSNISLIERGKSSASASVLDKLAAALGVTVSSLFDRSDAATSAPSPLSRQGQQLVWTDPASGYLRRTLSPAAASPIQLVEVTFPPGQRVVYDATTRSPELSQQVWILDGAMEIGVGNKLHNLQAGDCLAMQLNQPIVYFNPTPSPARYLVALAISPVKKNRDL